MIHTHFNHGKFVMFFKFQKILRYAHMIVGVALCRQNIFRRRDTSGNCPQHFFDAGFADTSCNCKGLQILNGAFLIRAQSLIGFERILNFNCGNIFRNGGTPADTECGSSGLNGFIQKIVGVKFFSGKGDKEFSCSGTPGVGENTVN